jgi:hypothetical protein
MAFEQAEWLLFLDKKQQAQTVIKAMMIKGWLPDSNVDPFIESGLGKSLFTKMLANNRQQVVTAI